MGSSRLPTLKINGKVLAIAATTLIGMATIAAIYLTQQAQIEVLTIEERILASEFEILADARKESEAVRALVGELVLAPTADAVAIVDATLADLAERAERYGDMPEVQAGMLALPAYATEVVAQATALGLDEDSGLKGALRSAVHNVEALMEAEAAGGLSLDAQLVQMLMLRRHEKDFMLRKSDKYVGKFDEQIESFTQSLPGSTLSLASRGEIIDFLNSYKANFHAFVEGTGEMDSAYAKLLEQVAGELQLIETRYQSVVMDRNAVQAQLADQWNLFSIVLISTIVAAALVSVLLAMLIGRSIVKPVTRLSDTMRAVAGGALDLEVPGKERSDEIGDMARAVEVFRENGLKVAKLNAAEEARAGQTRERTHAMNTLIESLAGVVGAALEGDFSQRIGVTLEDDNLRGVAASVNSLVETVDRGLSETGEVLAALAETNLTQRVKGDYKGAFLKLKTDTNAVGDRMTDIIGQLRQTCGTLKTATGEILSGANDLAERTTKQAAAIEETSAAMEQLANTVVENARRAETASTKARAVAKTGEDTGAVMHQANAAMERITTSSDKISNIIGLIDDIAFQTNLLALNASVEAARAGEAGKGFAVVAVEVRRLAQSAAQASKEVKVLIDQSAGEVKGGSQLVADAAGKLLSMLGAVQENSTLIDGIAQASKEQSSAIVEVTTAIRQMDEMTQHNAALVEKTNAAIEQTESQAVELDRIVDIFTIEEQARTVEAAPAPRGIRGLQQKRKAAASSYLSRGNAAVDREWSEF